MKKSNENSKLSVFNEFHQNNQKVQNLKFPASPANSLSINKLYIPKRTKETFM